MLRSQKKNNPALLERTILPPGIRNSGNTCFANSVMQCLLSHPFFNNWLQQALVQANKKVTIQQSCVMLYNYNHAESRKAVLECFDVLNSSFGYASVHRVLQSSSVTEMIRLLHGMIIVSLQ